MAGPRPIWKGALTISCTWNRGVLITNRADTRWVQLNLGRGGTARRFKFWPRFGSINLRVWDSWWLGFGWSGRPLWIDRVFPGWMSPTLTGFDWLHAQLRCRWRSLRGVDG